MSQLPGQLPAQRPGQFSDKKNHSRNTNGNASRLGNKASPAPEKIFTSQEASLSLTPGIKKTQPPKGQAKAKLTKNQHDQNKQQENQQAKKAQPENQREIRPRQTKNNPQASVPTANKPAYSSDSKGNLPEKPTNSKHPASLSEQRRQRGQGGQGGQRKQGGQGPAQTIKKAFEQKNAHPSSRLAAKSAGKLPGKFTNLLPDQRPALLPNNLTGNLTGNMAAHSFAQLPTQLPGLFTLLGSLKFDQITAELEGLESKLRESLRPKAAHFKNLPFDIAALSNILTEERVQLARPYWSEARYLAAYLWYFLPWNLVRLAPLLTNLPLNITPGYKILDLGSGPLTFPIALWLARPDLRNTPIHFICTDAHLPPMQAGNIIFASIRGENCPWQIELKKADLKDALGQFKQKNQGSSGVVTSEVSPLPSPKPAEPTSANTANPTATQVDLIVACNVFNELKRPRDVSMPLFLKNIMHGMRGAMPIGTPNAKLTTKPQNKAEQELLQKQEAQLAQVTQVTSKKSGPALLIVEPGNRLGGKIITMLRHAGQEMGLNPASPCPHNGVCPMLQPPTSTFAAREDSLQEQHPRTTNQATPHTSTLRTWCHFVQNSPPVPAWLQNISKAAGLYKTHTALSFVLLNASNKTEPDLEHDNLLGRIISNPFAVPGQPGLCRYACTQKGMALLPNVEYLPSGTLLPLTFNNLTIDSKSGAIIMHPLRSKKQPELQAQPKPNTNPNANPGPNPRPNPRPKPGTKPRSNSEQHNPRPKPKHNPRPKPLKSGPEKNKQLL